MPTQTIEISPFASIYVGAAPPGGGTLIQVNSKRTKGSILEFDIPEEFQEVAENSVQTGRTSLSVAFRFMGRDSQTTALACGNAVNATPPDQPSQFAKYTVLIVDPDELSNTSIFIPECYTRKSFKFNKDKNAATETPVTFVWVERNRFNRSFYQDDLAALLALPAMSGRSPF